MFPMFFLNLQLWIQIICCNICEKVSFIHARPLVCMFRICFIFSANLIQIPFQCAFFLFFYCWCVVNAIGVFISLSFSHFNEIHLNALKWHFCKHLHSVSSFRSLYFFFACIPSFLLVLTWENVHTWKCTHYTQSANVEW